MSFFSTLASAIWVDAASVNKAAIRTWAAIVEGFIDGNAWQTIVKQTDQLRNTTTTLAADSALVVPMLANTKYLIEVRAKFKAPATPDMKIGFTGPASPTRISGERRSRGTGSTTMAVIGIAAYDTSGLALTGDDSTPGQFDLDLIVENGANAGNFELTWAQNTSNGSDSTMLLGSYLRWRKVTP